MSGLEPITDNIGPVVLRHGERGPELDEAHPGACLCGQDDYFSCPDWLAGTDSLMSLTIYPAAPDDEDYVARPALGRTHPYGTGAAS